MGVIMALRRSDLPEAFFVPGTQPFRVRGDGTSDALEEVLRQDYSAAAQALLRPGELIYVSTCPQGKACSRGCRVSPAWPGDGAI